jgi:hypothetical protein
MRIRFENVSTKRFLARKGPAKVFGKNVDAGERQGDAEAIEWFDQVWTPALQREVAQAKPCETDFVRSKLPVYA